MFRKIAAKNAIASFVRCTTVVRNASERCSNAEWMEIVRAFADKLNGTSRTAITIPRCAYWRSVNHPVRVFLRTTISSDVCGRTNAPSFGKRKIELFVCTGRVRQMVKRVLNKRKRV